MCPLNNQSLVLGVLVDLCENPKVCRTHIDTVQRVCVYLSLSLSVCVALQAIQHLVAWRGREGGVSSWSLLASLWRQEETEMGVPRSQAGDLAGQLEHT